MCCQVEDWEVLSTCGYDSGLYLATAGQDCKLVVWDVRAKKAVATQECPEQLVSLEWQPGGNRLLAMTEEGRLVEWKNAIPDSLPGPCEQVSSPQGLASRSRLSTPAGEHRVMICAPLFG